MKPPYTITREIIQLIASVSEKIGAINASHLYKPVTELRKKNRIRTIQSSLEIEGNTLTENQITALLENKRVIAPKKDILEVQNAIRLYDQLHQFNPYKRKDLEKAHAVLMKGLVEQAGAFRTSNVGIVKGAKVAHIAPEGAMVNGLMNDLFEYLKKDDDLLLIKSCVFHYEFEFIHPFTDGNGRMGRFWQTVILTKQFPVFEFLPVEHFFLFLIKKGILPCSLSLCWESFLTLWRNFCNHKTRHLRRKTVSCCLRRSMMKKPLPERNTCSILKIFLHQQRAAI